MALIHDDMISAVISPRKIRHISDSFPSEKLIHGDAEHIGKLRQQHGIGAALIGLPLADGLIGHFQFLSKLLLGQSQLLAVSSNDIS